MYAQKNWSGTYKHLCDTLHAVEQDFRSKNLDFPTTQLSDRIRLDEEHFTPKELGVCIASLREYHGFLKQSGESIPISTKASNIFLERFLIDAEYFKENLEYELQAVGELAAACNFDSTEQ